MSCFKIDRQTTQKWVPIALMFLAMIGVVSGIWVVREKVMTPESKAQKSTVIATVSTTVTSTVGSAGTGVADDYIARRQQTERDHWYWVYSTAPQVFAAEKAASEQAERARQEAQRVAAEKRAAAVRVSSAPSHVVASGDGDAQALAVLRSAGLSESEISEAWWIHLHEGGWNSHTGQHYGGWQIATKVHGVSIEQACDPAWSTRWFLDYCNARYGGVHGAYTHKQRTGWY